MDDLCEIAILLKDFVEGCIYFYTVCKTQFSMSFLHYDP